MGKRTQGKKHGFVHVLTFLPAAVVAAGLLLCFLLRYLKPEFLFFPSLVGYAFPVLLLLGFVFVILYLIFLRWKVLLFVVCIAINYPNIVALLRGKGLPEPPKMEWVSADRFKVLTYNVRLFNYYGEIPGEKQQIKEQLLDYVKDQDADVVCFQEYYESKNSSFTLGRKLPQAGYRHHTKPASNKNFHYGNIIYSKFPIIREGSLQGLSRFDVVFADLLVHQDTLRVYNIHLESNRFDKTDRAFFEHLRASSQNNGKDVDYTRGAQRMLGKVKKATLRRSDQVRRLIRHVQDSLAPSRVLVCGDMNDQPISYVYGYMRRQDFKDAFVEAGSGFGQSYKGYYPSYRIDYLFSKGNLQVLYFNTQEVEYSDHKPLTAVFQSKSSTPPAPEDEASKAR